MGVCVSEKSDFKKKIRKQCQTVYGEFYIQIIYLKKNLSFILKLCIQNNLSNILTYKNRSFFFFFIYSILEFEYRKEKMKSEYITF